MGTEDIVERLGAIADELADLAFDRLREASASMGESAAPDPHLAEQERRLTRARRSVEKAVSLLQGRPEDE